MSGGTVVQDGLLVLRATRVGGDTALARITALVTAAQSGKAPCSGWPTASPRCSSPSSW